MYYHCIESSVLMGSFLYKYIRNTWQKWFNLLVVLLTHFRNQQKPFCRNQPIYEAASLNICLKCVNLQLFDRSYQLNDLTCAFLTLVYMCICISCMYFKLRSQLNKCCKSLTTRWDILLFVTNNWLCKIKYVPSYCHHIIFNFTCGIAFTNKPNNIFCSSKNWCVLVNADITCKVIFWSRKVDSVLLITAKTHCI